MVFQTVAVSHTYSDYLRFRLYMQRPLIRLCTLVTCLSMRTHRTYYSDRSAVDIRYLTTDAWSMTLYLAASVDRPVIGVN
jgi:hypothetical protein